MSKTHQNQGYPQSGTSPEAFRLVTLGSVGLARIAGDAAAPVLGPGKPIALLLYLNQLPGRAGSRDHIVDLLWSDVPTDAGRHTLRQTIHALNQRLGQQLIVVADGHIRLTRPIPSDRFEFMVAVEQGRSDMAVSLYGGEFLPGFAVPGGADFEQWADTERRRLQLMFLRSAESLTRQLLDQGRARDAQKLARRVRDADPLDERGWRLLLEALHSAGDTTLAAVEAADLERILTAEERDAEPPTQGLLNQIRALPAVAQSSTRAGTLVAELVGREREFSAIINAWDASRRRPGRHLHLSAHAGIGKTRLPAGVHARLRAMGARVVSVRANIGDRHISFALAAELAERLCALPGTAGVSPGSAALLVGLNPSLSSRFAGAPDLHGDPDELIRRRGDALAEALTAACDDAPVAVLIDDVHWADSASRQMLSALVRTPSRNRALIVSAGRLTPEGTLRGTETDTLGLEPLTVPGVAALIASLGVLPPSSWTRGFPDALHAATGGTPLAILEMLQLLQESGLLVLADESWECGSPQAMLAMLDGESALVRRIGQLERNARWLLVLLTVAGLPVADDILVRAVSRSPEAVRADLTVLEQRGLIQRIAQDWMLAHDQISEIVEHDTDGLSLRAAHVALARSLACANADVDDLLRAGSHLSVAERGQELSNLFCHCVERARERSDRRSLDELARRFLGAGETTSEVARLIASLPAKLRPGRRSALVPLAALLLVALIGAGLDRILERTPVRLPDAELLVVIRTAAGDTIARRIPIERDHFPAASTIDAAGSGVPYRWPFFHGYVSEAAVSPDGRRWIIGQSVSDSGAGNDLFLAQPGMAERRLTYAHGDDLHPSWSPDQRQIAFATTRWNAHAWADIAIMDLATGQVRPLTIGEDVDSHPLWSPDGSRVAFTRRLVNGSTRICWITVDHAVLRCPPVKDAADLRIVGWHDARYLIVVATHAGSSDVLLLDADNGEERTIARDSLIGNESVSPDGRWFSCRCQSRGHFSGDWKIYPVDNPDRVTIAVPPAGGAIAVVRLLASRPTPGPLERLAIRPLPGPLPLGVSEHLFALGRDTTGNPSTVMQLRWSSTDTSVATINATTGLFRPRRAGTVWIRATTGGWRSAWIRLTVASAPVRAAFAEDWRHLLESQWIPYGDPRPLIDSGPGNAPAMNNNGNGTFKSGVYSRQVFSGANGIGLEMRLSTRVNAREYQQLTAWIAGGLTADTLKRWDRKTGIIPRGVQGSQCGMQYPELEGDPRAASLATPFGGVPSPSFMRSGAWYVVRLQIFPDGSCGVAINGNPVGRGQFTESPITLYGIILEGSSVGTKMLVGPLDVWQGVKTDVDWSRLDR